MKTCKKCGVEKPLAEFSRHNTTVDRLQPWCKPCKAEYLRGYRRTGGAALRQKRKVYLDANRDKINRQHRDRYGRNPESARQVLEWRIKRDFGLAMEEYDRLIAGPCHICGTTPPPGTDRRQGIVLDHCHETNKVRGALCQLAIRDSASSKTTLPSSVPLPTTSRRTDEVALCRLR